jgi:Tfp pilus assembly protein PilV
MHSNITDRSRGRRGIALIEVVIAVFLFGFGCLAMISSQTAITKLRTSRLEAHALATFAHNTLDSLRGISCARVGSGTLSAPPGTLTWTATGYRRIVELQLSATPARGGAPWTISTTVPCAP